MNIEATYLDIKQILTSKRATYTILLMASFALVFALVTEFSPTDLKAAMEAAMPPGSAGLFEYVWFGDVMLFLLLAVVGFGAFVTSDLEDEGTVDLLLAKPETRSAFLSRRLAASLISFIIIYIAGSLAAGIIAWPIVGNLDLALFLWHHLELMPMLLFVIALTFLVGVPLRATTPTVLAGFAIPLMLALTHMFSSMSDPGAEPTLLNPMAYATRVFTGQPLPAAAALLMALSIALFAAGWAWFCKKDI